MIAAAASCGLPNHLFAAARANLRLVLAAGVAPGHPHDSSLGRRHAVRAANKDRARCHLSKRTMILLY
jgi:hypothetical protein